MKLLYIGNKLSKHGNTPTAVETLGSLLSEEFDIITVSDKKNKLVRLADMLFSVFRYRKDIDFVLIDTYSTSNFYFALFCASLARWFNLKYIPILHGGNLPNRLQTNPRLVNLIFQNAYINVAPSEYLLEVFHNNGFNVVHIPNNIEIENYKFKRRQKLSVKLLYVRAFSFIYNPKMALMVLENLLNRFPDASLCMVGPDRDGTLHEIKELCHEMELDGKVIFTGKLTKKEWWTLSEEYDIFINTTNFDNTPVSVMEAMALGLPVVTTNVGGIPYLIEDGVDGLLVDANDTERMSEKIEQLVLKQEEAFKIAKNARKKVESFDWKNVKRKWFDLLEGGK